MIIIIDNYDSFTYNIVQYVGDLGYAIKVFRNNEITIQQIKNIIPNGIIISPGPGSPSTAGISKEIIKNFAYEIPILGICLGHQSIGDVYGANIVHAPKPIHGKTSLIYHNAKGIFQNIPNPFIATRYHSLLIDSNNLPKNLIVTAWTNEGIIMGCQLKNSYIQGIQFHPESLWTACGQQLLKNFLNSI